MVILLIKKIWRLGVICCGVILAFPIVVVVRLIEPLICIRFGKIRSDVLGHSVFDPAYYLSRRELEPSNTVDFFYFSTEPHPNEYWKKMLQRKMWVNKCIRYCDYCNQHLPHSEKHNARLLPYPIVNDVDKDGIFFKTKTVIEFNKEEDRTGWKYLESLGMSSGDKYICLVARDSGYKNMYQRHIKSDWSYHDYRNSEIDGYSQAIQGLIDGGYWVLRMGKGATKPLNFNHPRVFDYAFTSDRSDFLDIWLMARAFFSISSGTGLDTVSTVYRRPVVYVDYLPLQMMVSYNSTITAPKIFYWLDNGNRLTMNETLSLFFQRTDDFRKNGIGILDLTAEEKWGAVCEMEKRLSGRWEPKKQDHELQAKFWRLLTDSSDFHHNHGVIHPDARLSATFLRQHGEWYLREETN